MISKSLFNKLLNTVSGEQVEIALGTGVAPGDESILLDQEVFRKSADTYIDEDTVIKELYIDVNEHNDVAFSNIATINNENEIQSGSGISLTKKAGESMTISIETIIERS